PSCPCLIFPHFVAAPAAPEFSTLSLHDALPISVESAPAADVDEAAQAAIEDTAPPAEAEVEAAAAEPVVEEAPKKKPARRTTRKDRKSTRLNSSHVKISYAVFCLKKKTK